MPEHDALLAAILASPEDDTPRLAYADFLDEAGDEDRAEFIRVEIELAHTPPLTEEDERRRRFLLERRADLLKQHKLRWLAPFLPHAREWEFDRGFVSSLDVSAASFDQHAERWFAVTPLQRVKFTTNFVWDDEGRRTTRSLLASPLLGRLEVIDLERTNLEPADVERFAMVRELPRLRELVLSWNAIGTPGAVTLAAMPQLKNLETLDLVSNGITDPGARAIAESPHLGNLKELRISRNPIRKRTWAALEVRFGDALVG